MKCRLSLYGFSTPMDKIVKHSVHCDLPSFHNAIFYVRVVKFTLFVFFTLGSSVFTFSAEILHPLSKNLNSITLNRKF